VSENRHAVARREKRPFMQHASRGEFTGKLVANIKGVFATESKSLAMI